MDRLRHLAGAIVDAPPWLMVVGIVTALVAVALLVLIGLGWVVASRFIH